MLPEPGSMREAALVIHALGDDDQRALLAHLNEGERLRVEPLLKELRSLGIPRSFDVRALLGQLKSDAAASPVHSANLRYLQQQSADTIVRALEQQSAATIALLLNAHAWRWKHEVQARLAAVAPVALHRGPTPVSPRVTEVIVAAACTRCQELLSTTAVAGGRKPVHTRSRWALLKRASREWRTWKQ